MQQSRVVTSLRIIAVLRVADLNRQAQALNRRTILKASLLAIPTVMVGQHLWRNRWNYIVIHHSAGGFGTIEFLQKVHRERQPDDPIDAIPYHYVIGNGNGLGMGEIASDWRRSLNLWGTHVSGNNFSHNFRGLGICLIGNIEETDIPVKQFDSLVALTGQLMEKYEITIDNIIGHGNIEGENTKCPGKNFPIEKLKRELTRKAAST